MNSRTRQRNKNTRSSRRDFIAVVGGGLGLGAAAGWYYLGPHESGKTAEVFVERANRYDGRLVEVIKNGLSALKVDTAQVRGRRILLKPNLVEPDRSRTHINTHPQLVRAAVESFLSLGAAEVLVAEGAGHRRDAMLVLEESGLGEVLREDGIRFVDLNMDELSSVANIGGWTKLGNLTIPATLGQVDWVVSMPKLKTHHWVGVTLSMKNLFGVMPGEVYGWPKNVLHQQGIHSSILDICSSVATHLTIVDGIVGMEEDGPIMGPLKTAGVIVMGANQVAVDATCCRIMGIDPEKIPYLAVASGRLGPIRDANIEQRGESPRSVRTDFRLLESIPSHHGIRLAYSASQK